jgi:phosphatidylglycerophosphatase A
MKRAHREKNTVEERAPFLYMATATLLGTGYFPVAPATAASAIVCFVIWFFFKHPLTYVVSILVIFTIGIGVSSKLEHFWGKDDRRIVIDEVAGVIIALFLVPQKMIFFALGFLLFRFFDILKPYPINVAQNLPKGWGVVIDDVIAGIYSNILLWIFIIIFYRML